MLGEQPGWQATNTLSLSGKYFSACAFSLLYVRDFRCVNSEFRAFSFLTRTCAECMRIGVMDAFIEIYEIIFPYFSYIFIMIM